MFNMKDRPAAAEQTTAASSTSVINFLLLSLVVLLPLLVLPLTTEGREFNKQALLFFAVAAVLILWVIRMLSTRSVVWVKTSLDYILASFLAVYLISSLFSIDKVSSFLGYYGSFTGSFISMLSLIVLYFLVVNNVRSQKLINRVVNCLFIGSGLVVVYSFLQLLGLYVLPFGFTHDRAFNPVGSMTALSIFTALFLVLIQWLWAQKDGGKFKKWAYLVLTLIGLAVMFFVNAFIGWVCLGLGLIVYAALAVSLDAERQEGGNSFWRPMLLIVISIVFVALQFVPIINPRQLININLPLEVQLSNSATWTLVKNAISAGPKQLILGTGPGTTGLMFGQIKPESLNKTVVWSLNFDRASSEIANLTIETGILGLLAFEATAILFAIYALYFLLKKTEHPLQRFALILFSLWVVLYISHFLYFFNTTFYFFYWFILAMFMAVVHSRDKQEAAGSLSLDHSARPALSGMFAALIMLAVLLIGAFFEAAVYGADVAYASGLRMLNQPNPDFNRVAAKFGQAINLNPYRDVYYLGYAQDLIFLVSQEAAKPKPDINKVQAWLADIIASGQKATQLSPAKAANWSSLAQFYSNIRSLATGADKFALDSWQQAIKLDGKNPLLYINLAQAYLNSAQVAQVDPKTGQNATHTDPAMLKKAEETLQIAINLKSDLPDGYIALARVFEQENQLDGARAELDKAVVQFPNNPDIIFEDGRIAYNQKNYDQAQQIFNRVLSLVPNHANAHYSLGLIYLQKGDKVKALAEFQKAREIAGPNVELEKLINSLQNPAPPPAKKK